MSAQELQHHHINNTNITNIINITNKYNKNHNYITEFVWGSG